MAFNLFTLFTLFVFLQIVFSLPIGDKIVGPVSAQDETSVLNQSVLAPIKNDDVKLSVVDNSRLNVLKRTKRSVIGDGKCSENMRWYMHQCVSLEEYDEMMGEAKR